MLVIGAPEKVLGVFQKPLWACKSWSSGIFPHQKTKHLIDMSYIKFKRLLDLRAHISLRCPLGLNRTGAVFTGLINTFIFCFSERVSPLLRSSTTVSIPVLMNSESWQTGDYSSWDNVWSGENCSTSYHRWFETIQLCLGEQAVFSYCKQLEPPHWSCEICQHCFRYVACCFSHQTIF